MGAVLVINSGSSSLKFAVVDPAAGAPAADGIVERIGQDASSLTFRAGTQGRTEQALPVPDHGAAFAAVHDLLAGSGVLDGEALVAVGHRVVHGGARFTAPAVVDDAVLAGIEEVAPLAPLHNPANLLGIRAAMAAYPQVPHVAVFDTAFHATLPAAAATYAIDKDVAAQHRFRRYGFHGTSHKYVSGRAAAHLGIPRERFDAVSLHLGNGASACAIQGGRSVETSMGVTPLEGLVMGTRSGDLDPAIVLSLLGSGMSAQEVDELLNRRSGLQGLCGDSDLRSVKARAAAGDGDAALAREVFVHRVRKYLGAYLAVLGRADAVLFTGGIGENDDWTRAHVCAGLAGLGIAIDTGANAGLRAGGSIRDITAAGAAVRVLVVPTDEEREIAHQAVDLVG
jgi:acetate kinase